MKQTNLYKSLKFYTERLIDLNWHKHPFFIPVATFLTFFFVAVGSFIVLNGREVLASDSYIVLLSHDDKREVVPTRTNTVGDLLKSVSITLGEGDVVEPDLDTAITEDNFRINVYRARPVMISDGGQKKFIFSAATTPRSVASQAGVDVYPEDNLKTEMPFSTLQDGAIGETIVIERATPAYLNLYGTPIPVRTHATTVADLLNEKQVALGAGDVVTPSPDTKLTPQTQIFVTRNGTRVETVEEEIKPETEIVEDSSLSFGASAVRQKGVPGKKYVTYEIQLKNDKETGRRVIQTVVATEPVKQIVARGKAVHITTDHESIMAAAGIKSSDYAYVQYIINHENALWCPTRWQGQRNCPAYYEEKFPGAESNTKTGYGLCQSTPANKMATAGADWRTNAVTQMKWCAAYAERRFGSWQAAYNYWIAHGNW